MRRRRGGNPLLWRMIGIGVLITVALLPLLAYLGAFKPGKGGLMQMTMINQPLPKTPKQPHAARKPQKTHPKEEARRPGNKSPASTKALPVHVAAAASPGPPSDNSIVNGSNTQIGKAPIPQPVAPVQPVTPVTPVVPAPVVAPPPVIKPPVIVAPPPVVVPPPAPHVPVIVAAVPLSQPQPEVPDDLRDDDLDKTCGVLLTIRADGTVDVTKVQSTGSDELDRAAVEAARKWRFRPATKDGVPSQSYLRVDIDFQVS